jgi:RsiW-degrading membrane proteinase PrsW (M82 family)
MPPQNPVTLLAAAGLAAVGSILWLFYFNLKDRLAPEPKRRIAQAFGLGVVSALLACGGYRAATLLGFPPSPPKDPGELIVYCMFVVGVVEEGAKFLVFRAVCARWKEFDERIDGLVYATAVALGFAALENVLFLRALPWPHGLLRVVVSPLTHSLFAAIWGFGTSRALLASPTRIGRFLWQALPLAVAMVLHGLYDVAVLVEQMTPVAAAIVAGIWGLVIWKTQRVLRLARAGGAEPADAPPSADGGAG